MGNEETLSGFPVKQAVPALVSHAIVNVVMLVCVLVCVQIKLLQMEHNFDMVCCWCMVCGVYDMLCW